MDRRLRRNRSALPPSHRGSKGMLPARNPATEALAAEIGNGGLWTGLPSLGHNQFILYSQPWHGYV